MALLVLAAPAAARGQTASALPTGHGEVRLERFRSGALGVTKGYTVYLPAAYADTARRFPVVYLLHGLFGDEASWVARGHLDVVADSAFAAGVPPMILVMPDGDQSAWVDWAVSPGIPCAAAEALSESVETACVTESRYAAYVARDLVVAVDARFRTAPWRAARGIGGISAGGTGALVIAFNAPAVFRAVAALSPVGVPLSLADGPCGMPIREARSMDALEAALGRPLPNWRRRWGSDTTLWWRGDPARAARRLVAGPSERPLIRLETGAADELAGGTCALSSTLDSLGLDAELSVLAGGHDWALWRARLGETLAWFAHHLSSAGPRSPE